MPTEKIEPLVNPTELDQFTTAAEAVARARQQSDRLQTIETPEQAGEAADALKALRIAREDIEAGRKAAKAPYQVTGSAIDAAFKELLSTPTAAEESLKARVAEWEAAERKKVEEEEKRLARNAARRQETENKRAEREGRASHHVAAPPPKAQPRGARGAHGNLVPRKVTKHRIVDESKLPEGYWKKEVDKKKVQASVNAGIVVPGVEVWQEIEYQAR